MLQAWFLCPYPLEKAFYCVWDAQFLMQQHQALCGAPAR